ncbi:MAG TPA: excinuclease ATPase subunit [Anaeromyxobacter sp.]
MRRLGFLAVLTILAVARPALGRDDHLMLPIKDALASPDAAKLDPGVKLYFGHARPSASRSLGTYTTNKKTNGFGKDDKVACERAFISAMLALQQRARAQGGNAVVGIASYYKKIVTASDKEYMCGAGAIVVGVAFRGEVVKL